MDFLVFALVVSADACFVNEVVAVLVAVLIAEPIGDKRT